MDAYELREQIGKGAFGAAFLVVHRDTKKQFVLKKIRLARQSEWQRKSSFQEMAMMQSLRHPYIVPHIESWVDRGHTINIIYGYCNNGDLASVLSKAKGKKPFPEEQLKVWLAELLMALDYTHAKNVLHRDIKSSNIFITAEGDVQIGDFGLATFREGGEEDDQSLVGTPHYMSPELLSKRPYGFKSDIWSLGCVMYELTALRPAFTAFNIQGLVHKIKKAAVAPLPSTYSSDWCILIKAMLRKRPDARPTVPELMAAPCMREALIEARERALRLLPDLELPPLPEPRPILPSRPTTPNARRGDGGYTEDEYDDDGVYDSEGEDESDRRERTRVPQSARIPPPSSARGPNPDPADSKKRPMSARSPHRTPAQPVRPMSALPNKNPTPAQDAPPKAPSGPQVQAKVNTGIRSLAPRPSAPRNPPLAPASEADESQASDDPMMGDDRASRLHAANRTRSELSSHHVTMSDDEDSGGPMTGAAAAAAAAQHRASQQQARAQPALPPPLAVGRDAHAMPSPGRLPRGDMGPNTPAAAAAAAAAAAKKAPAPTPAAPPSAAPKPAAPTPSVRPGLTPSVRPISARGAAAASGRPAAEPPANRGGAAGPARDGAAPPGSSKELSRGTSSGSDAAHAARRVAVAPATTKAPASSIPRRDVGPRAAPAESGEESDSTDADPEEAEMQRERLQTLERALALCARLLDRGRVDELSYILHSLSATPEPAVPPGALNTDPAAYAGVRLQSMLKTRQECPFQLGDQVIVGNRRRLKAIIRYFGPTAFGPGEWVGMELEKAEGKNDGTVNGIPYFQCPPGCGLFVKANILKPESDAAPGAQTAPSPQGQGPGKM